MYKVFLHIGLHRTGTTAIQHFLAANTDRLESAGVAVARSGTPPDMHGNHELAWGYVNDTRMMSRWRNLDAELSERRGDRLIIRSEDFSCLSAEDIYRVAGFCRLIRAIPPLSLAER